MRVHLNQSEISQMRFVQSCFAVYFEKLFVSVAATVTQSYDIYYHA